MSNKDIFSMAWLFIKANAYTRSEALKTAWANAKVTASLRVQPTRFAFTKVDGSRREAYGTLVPSMLPPLKGSGRKPSRDLQVYFDLEKEEYRCFKRANLLGLI